VGRGGAFALYQAATAETAELIATALGSHALLELAARFGDALSRRWLKRRGNPFCGEITLVADALGRPGVYLLNIIYEWSCSTSAAPDPGGSGNRMIRILDWGMPGIGRHIVLGRHTTDHGLYYNVTWPGFAGVLTAMAPGRFAAAINQAPRQTAIGVRWLDEAIVHLRMYAVGGTLPAPHLLRQVFEAAPNYAAALTMLMDTDVDLAMPALFTLSGAGPEETCVIEAIGRRRIAHRGKMALGGIVGVANRWLTAELPGKPRDNALTPFDRQTAEANNLERQRGICDLQRGTFTGVADLAPPLLNSHTVLVASANAREGQLTVEALDGGGDGSVLPTVIGRVIVE
jgi:hypothetical protein